MNYKSRTHVDLHVIDAIDKNFLATWGTEAEMLGKALAGAPIKIVAHSAVDSASLCEAFETIRNYRATYIYPRHSVPYVHISCHGRKDALILGDSQEMSWSELSEALLPLLKTTDYHLALSLSSCWGYHGASLAYVMSSKYVKRRPYYSLVGPLKDEDARPLCAAFAEFYRHLFLDFKRLKKSVHLANKIGPAKLDYTKGSHILSLFGIPLYKQKQFGSGN
jgi:hypothetical protein